MTTSKQSQDGTAEQFHPEFASGWLHKKKSITMHGNMNVQKNFHLLTKWQVISSILLNQASELCSRNPSQEQPYWHQVQMWESYSHEETNTINCSQTYNLEHCH